MGTADLSIIINGVEVLAGIGAVWSLIRSQRILFAASPKPQAPPQPKREADVQSPPALHVERSA